MNGKGQSGIEYLIIFGATILIVAIVIVSLTGSFHVRGKQSSELEDFCEAHNMKYQYPIDCIGLTQNDELLTCKIGVNENLIYFDEPCNWKNIKKNDEVEK